jgi:hypothetical protein
LVQSAKKHSRAEGTKAEAEGRKEGRKGKSQVREQRGTEGEKGIRKKIITTNIPSTEGWEPG